MSVVPELTVRALQDTGAAPLPHYEASLKAACEIYPPPYGMAWYGDKYRDVSVDPRWLAQSLVANAIKEGEGSQKLWQLAGRTPAPEVAEQIRQHAIDESRHARMYIGLLEIAFPEATDELLRPTLFALSPGYTQKDRPPESPPANEATVLDEIIQMNIGEIRTRIHQLLLRPVIIAHCAQERHRKLSGILDSLLADETRHIEYTARLIDQACERGHEAFVRTTTADRVAEFNHITLDEVGEQKFEGA